MSSGHMDHCPKDTGINKLEENLLQSLFSRVLVSSQKADEIVDMQKNVPIGLEMPELQYAYIFWEIFETSYYHIIIFSHEDMLNSDQENMQKQNLNQRSNE